jgi:hypothetical protein
VGGGGRGTSNEAGALGRAAVGCGGAAAGREVRFVCAAVESGEARAARAASATSVRAAERVFTRGTSGPEQGIRGERMGKN